MKIMSSQFSNLLGSVYRRGNLDFSKGGGSLYTPVGNQVRYFDFKNDSSYTIGINSRKNIVHLLLSPTANLLITIDEDGQASLSSLLTSKVISKFHFKCAVTAAAFSPNGKYILIAKERMLWLYHAPTPDRQFNQFILKRAFTGPTDDIISIDWTGDSRVFAVGCVDGDTRIYAVTPFANLVHYALGGQIEPVVGCHFASDDSLDIISISTNAQIRLWSCDTQLSELVPLTEMKKTQNAKVSEENDVSDDEQFDCDLDAESDRIDTKMLIEETKRRQQPVELAKMKVRYTSKRKSKYTGLDTEERVSACVSATSYHRPNGMLVTGFDDGTFMIHMMPGFTPLQQLNISQCPISCIRVNKDGRWIAFGVEDLGQLAVWEWEAETFHIRQESHFNAMNSLCFSPSGQYIATGGLDGKVKVWDNRNGLCFVTFTEHTSGVTCVAFAMHKGLVLFSASLDGTVRAYDLGRYRNFRTFTAPEICQFSCLGVDSSGDFIAAGGVDTFSVHLWSVKTGQLLDVLTGHEAPISDVQFMPNSNVLTSVSWDKTARVWNVLDSGDSRDVFHMQTDVICLAFRPDGKELAVACLNGHIIIINPETGQQKASIEAKTHLGYFKRDGEKVTAKKASEGRTFQSLCYSANGEYLLAAGQSKYVCLFSSATQMLLRKYEITCNYSLEGVQEIHDRRRMTEWGSMALIDMGEGDKNGKKLKLPGVKVGDYSSRAFKPEVRVSKVQFSPTGASWAATTTEGLLVFTLDSTRIFNTSLLEEDVTPDQVHSSLSERDFASALNKALRLKQKGLLVEVIEQIPLNEVNYIACHLAEPLRLLMLNTVAEQISSSKHFGFYLVWAQCLLKGLSLQQLKNLDLDWRSAVLQLKSACRRRGDTIELICNRNRGMIDYLTSIPITEQSDDGVQFEDNEPESEAEEESLMEPLMKKIRIC